MRENLVTVALVASELLNILIMMVQMAVRNLLEIKNDFLPSRCCKMNMTMIMHD